MAKDHKKNPDEITEAEVNEAMERITNEKKAKKKRFFASRRFKYGSLSTALTVSLIAVVLILNIVCTTLTTNYSLKLDISGSDLFNLDDQTRQIINKVDKDVQFYVLSAESDYESQFVEILRRITLASDRFSLEFIDPDKNPTFATSFGSQYNISKNSLVLQCGDKVRVVKQSEMYEIDQTSYAYTYLLEERVAAALMGFMQEGNQLIYFVTGHGESEDSDFRNLFANNGYTVEDVKLYKDMSFDENATTMVIVNPTLDYSQTEISVVENFLSNGYMYGRNLMVFTDAAAVKLPNLESFLYDWGITLENNMVLEGDSSLYISNPSIFMPGLSNNDITAKLNGADMGAVMKSARSISTRFEKNGNLTVVPILETTSTSYGKSLDKVIMTYSKEPADAEGPLTVAAYSQYARVYNNQDVYSNVFVAGSAGMLSNTNQEQFSFASYNSKFLLSVYNMMMQQEDDTILEAVKHTSSQVMTLTDAQKTLVNVVTLGVIPGIVLLIGLIVCIRRRYL